MTKANVLSTLAIILLIINLLQSNWPGVRSSKAPTASAEVDEEKIEVLRREADWYQLLPDGTLFHKPDAKRVFSWGEHPKGEIHSATNNLGFRSDRPTTMSKPKGLRRILVLGDSHIDGVVDNQESVASLLERGLPGWEVLNAGCGYHGPFDYLEVARHFIDLDIDAYLVIPYLGNDLYAGLNHVTKRNLLPRPQNYFTPLLKAEKIHPGAVAQSLNQAYFFLQLPFTFDLAIASSVSAIRSLFDFATKQGRQLLVVPLPTKLEVEWDADDERRDKAVSALGLTKTQILAHLRRARLDFLQKLHQSGVDAIDPFVSLTEKMVPARERYWRMDHHLSAAGHEDLSAFILNYWGNQYKIQIKK